MKITRTGSLMMELWIEFSGQAWIARDIPGGPAEIGVRMEIYTIFITIFHDEANEPYGKCSPMINRANQIVNSFGPTYFLVIRENYIHHVKSLITKSLDTTTVTSRKNEREQPSRISYTPRSKPNVGMHSVNTEHHLGPKLITKDLYS